MAAASTLFVPRPESADRSASAPRRSHTSIWWRSKTITEGAKPVWLPMPLPYARPDKLSFAKTTCCGAVSGLVGQDTSSLQRDASSKVGGRFADRVEVGCSVYAAKMRRLVGYAVLFFAAATIGSTFLRLCGLADKDGGTNG
jgi:hypothetical protein